MSLPHGFGSTRNQGTFAVGSDGVVASCCDEAVAAEATIARFRALPTDQYPHLIEVATAAMRSDAVLEFDAGLDLLIAGLSAAA